MPRNYMGWKAYWLEQGNNQRNVEKFLLISLLATICFTNHPKRQLVEFLKKYP